MTRSCFQIVESVELDQSPELVAIHKESNHGVMHEYRLGETDCFSRQAFDPCPQRQMFTFDLLRVDFTHGVGSGGQVSLIDSSCIGVKMDQPKRLEEGF